MSLQRLKDRLTRHCATLEKLYDTYDLLAANPKGRVEMDTGDGRVEYTNRSLGELDKAIHRLENGIDLIERKLGGKGIVSFSLRRNVDGIRRNVV